jgi:hypothetical protein
MVVKNQTQRLAAFLSELKEPHGIKSRQDQEAFFERAKRVRTKDYIFPLDVRNPNFARAYITTMAGWFFILTGASVYFEELGAMQFPRIAVTFPSFVPSSPFDAGADKFDAVPAGLVFGREGVPGLDFEEQKNLFYPLGDAFEIKAEAYLDNNVAEARGYLLLTGVEIDWK